MRIFKSDRYIWFLLLAAFLLSGIFHVALYGVPYTASVVQIFGGTVVLCWMVSLLRRIVDRRVRLPLVILAGLMAFYFAIQLSKYKLFTTPAVLRYTWYCFYIPENLMPLCLFFLALFMNHPEDEVVHKRWMLLLIPAAVITCLVLSNDLHFLAFRFPEGLQGNTGVTGTYTYGPLFYLVMVWEVVLMLASLIISLRKCGTTVSRKEFWLPAGTLLVGGILLILNIVGLSPKVMGVTIWQTTETYVFMVMLFVEGCIYIGMIPSNIDYGRIFSQLPMPSAIYDPQGRMAVTSAAPMPKIAPMSEVARTAGTEAARTAGTLEAADPLEVAEPSVKVETMQVYGGSVVWTVDLSTIDSLNQQIMEVTGQIESRNERLLSENQMKEEQAGLEARNQLYDRIAASVKPQLEQIEDLLRGVSSENFKAVAARINVLNAYIKRRSNMELLQADTGRLPISELTLAIRESLEYLKDMGITGSVNMLSGEELPAALVIQAYECFEQVVEANLDQTALVAAFVSFQASDKPAIPGSTGISPESAIPGQAAGLQIRLMIQDRNGQERISVIRLPEGGAV